MIDHVSLQVTDVPASRAFYEAVLAPLGLFAAYTDGDSLGFSDRDRAPFWIGPAATSAPTRELHIAFSAADRAAVQAFFEAAESIGAEVLHAPQVFPEYDESYFACFIRDPDGHNIEAVCRSAVGESAGE